MQYLISVIDDEQTRAEVNTSHATAGEPGPVEVFNDKLKAGGHWVYANGLAAPETATVIDNRGGQSVVTDGPFLKSKEYLGGLWIIAADNLDVALELAAEGSKCCNRKVEVRAFNGDPA